MVLPYLPNEADATFSDQAEPDSVDFEILLLGDQGTGVISGCAVTESGTPAQTVDVAAGEVSLGGQRITTSGATGQAITAADVTNPRFDLISINSSGSVVVTAGTAAAQPVLPDVPASSVPLAVLYVPANDNTHTNDQIVDKRVFVPAPTVYNVLDYGATGDGTTDDTTAIQNAVDSMSRGDHLYFPVGEYRITSAINFGTLRGIRISGAGGQSANEGSAPFVGAAIQVETNGQVGFDFNPAAASLIHEGPVIENLNFIDNTPLANAILVRIDDMNYWTIRNCTFRPDSTASTGGTGVQLLRTNDNSWNMLDQCRFIAMDLGLDIGLANVVVVGGNFVFGDGQVGAQISSGASAAGQHTRIIGTKFDGGTTGGTGIEILGGAYNRIIGCSFEACDIGVDITDGGGAQAWHGGRNIIDTCNFSESQNPGPVIGVRVGSGCVENRLTNNVWNTDVGTILNDLGTRTFRWDSQIDPVDRFNVKAFGATGDGTTDDTAAIQAAWDAMTAGGVLVIPPGNYRLASSLQFVNGSDIGSAHVTILASGAVLEPDVGVTALILSSNENPRPGPSIHGLKIDGASGAGTNGIQIHNGNHWKLYDVWVQDCPGFGIQLRSDTALAGYGSQVLFSEGTHLYGCHIQTCGTGLDIVTAGTGTGSFAETVIASLILRNNTIGLSQDSGSNLHRSRITGVTAFMLNASGVKAFVFDGNLDEVQMSLATEGASGANTLTHVEIGTNATNTEKVDAWLSFTGTGAEQDRLSILNGGRFPYREGGRFAGLLEIRPDFWDDAEQVTGILLDEQQIRSGTGTPESSITADPGWVYLRDDGPPHTYVKAYGTGNTGWRSTDVLHNVKDYGATGDGSTDDYTAIAAAITAASSGGGGIVFFPPGTYMVGTSIELADGVQLRGVSPHASFGSVLKAHSSLGATPLLVNTTGNLTSGGIFNLRIEGTGDGTGGVGIRIDNSAIADHWTMDHINVVNFTSHGIHFDLTAGEVAGNPGDFGVINCFSNGAGGTGHGILMERANAGVIRFRYLGGDDNAGSLIYLDILNTQSHVVIDVLKAERQTDGTHDDVVTVNNANGGALTIGTFRLYHNVSAGTDGNALIRNTGDATLRLFLGLVFQTEAGSNTYTYGYDDGATQIPFAGFDRKEVTVKLRRAASEVSAATELDWTHGVVNVDTSGGAVTITLPDNSSYSSKNFLIRRDGASAVTINRAGTDTFDDASTSKSLDSDGAAIGIFSIGDGEWKIVATTGTVS